MVASQDGWPMLGVACVGNSCRSELLEGGAVPADVGSTGLSCAICLAITAWTTLTLSGTYPLATADTAGISGFLLSVEGSSWADTLIADHSEAPSKRESLRLINPTHTAQSNISPSHFQIYSDRGASTSFLEAVPSNESPEAINLRHQSPERIIPSTAYTSSAQWIKTNQPQHCI